MADRARFFDGKKFMWDSEEYADEKAAQEVAKKYSDDGFEVRSCEADGKVLLYTRRVVTEVVLE